MSKHHLECLCGCDVQLDLGTMDCGSTRMFIIDLSCSPPRFFRGLEFSSPSFEIWRPCAFAWKADWRVALSLPIAWSLHTVLSLDVFVCLPCIWQPTFPSDPDANFDPFLVILSHFCQERGWEVEARRLCSRHRLPLNSDCNGYVGTCREHLCVSCVCVYSHRHYVLSLLYIPYTYTLDGAQNPVAVFPLLISLWKR